MQNIQPVRMIISIMQIFAGKIRDEFLYREISFAGLSDHMGLHGYIGRINVLIAFGPTSGFAEITDGNCGISRER